LGIALCISLLVNTLALGLLAMSLPRQSTSWPDPQAKVLTIGLRAGNPQARQPQNPQTPDEGPADPQVNPVPELGLPDPVPADTAIDVPSKTPLVAEAGGPVDPRRIDEENPTSSPGLLIPDVRAIRQAVAAALDADTVPAPACSYLQAQNELLICPEVDIDRIAPEEETRRRSVVLSELGVEQVLGRLQNLAEVLPSATLLQAELLEATRGFPSAGERGIRAINDQMHRDEAAHQQASRVFGPCATC
jgi:hypothetical protein